MDVPRFTSIEEWLARENNRLLPEASSVYCAWLDADGDLDLVRASIEEWLGHDNNRLLPEASFVYRRWLDRTKDTAFIKDALAEWLLLHGSDGGSDFVYRAWLQARGGFPFIREQVFAWMRTHPLEHDAVHLLKYVVKQRALPDDVALKALDWCSRFAADPEAIWRLSTLSAHLSGDLFEDALRAAESVLEPVLDRADLEGRTRSQVTTILGNLATLEHLNSQVMSPALSALLLRWIGHAQSFEPSSRHAPHHQTHQFVARLLAAVEAEAEMPDVRRLMAWIRAWRDWTRVECAELLERLVALSKAARRRRGGRA